MHRRRAMTLVELLLVVFILAALAASASSMVEGAHEQARFDDNRTRLEVIRRGILGAEDLSLPAAGYVADVGAPPASIRDLVQRPAAVPLYAVDATYKVGNGWRGPYLRAAARLTDGALEFPDGWGTPEAFVGDPDFGWRLGADAPAPGDLTITSLGADGSPGPAASSTLNYAVDTSLTVSRDEHHVDLGPWRVEVTLDSSTPQTDVGLALRVWSPSGSATIQPIDGVRNLVDLIVGSNVRSLDFDPVAAAWTKTTPHGVRAVELCRHDGTNLTPFSPPQFVLVDLRARAALPVRLTRAFNIP